MSQGMSFDRRRVNGPEFSFPPVFEVEEAAKTPVVGRPSGRAAKDIRPIFMKTGLISQANGSAYMETERSKIACAVYGPRQAAKNAPYSETGKLNVEVKFAPFSCTKRRVPIKDAEDRNVSVLIHQSLLPSLRLELFPKSTIDVFITILENDGLESCVASGATAASTALADAGIEMLGLVMSCAASVVEGNQIWLDPTIAESASARGSLTLACMPALGTITNVWQMGKMSPTEAIQCMEDCAARCSDIHQVVAQALLESASGSS